MSVTVELAARFITTPIISGFNRHYHAPEYKDKRGLLLFNSFLLVSIQSFGLALLFFLFKNVISIIILENKDLVYIVGIYVFILLFSPIDSFLLAFLRQEEKAKFYVFISWTRFILCASFILFGLIYLKIGLLALIYGNLIGILFTIVCIFPLFWKYSTHKISFSVLTSPLKYGYPRILTGFSNILIQSGDRYVLRLFSSLSTVGLYSFGYNLAGIINFLLVVPLKQSIQPIAFKQEANPERQRDFLKRSSTYFYLVGMFVCLLLSLYSKEVIEIMARKREFWNVWVIVPIIAFSYLQHGLGNFLGWGLLMAKKSVYISQNIFIAAVVNIGLNLVFVPIWGILGAAFATLVSYLVWNGLKIYYSRKFYNLHFDLRRLLHITFLGIGLYFMSLFVAHTRYMLLNIFVKFLILLAYPLSFFITEFFTIKEKIYIRKLWRNVKQYGLYGIYARIKAV